MNTTMTIPMREALRRLQTLPGIGPRMAADLLLLGYDSPNDLVGANPIRMVERLEEVTGTRQDAGVLDVFQCAVYVADLVAAAKTGSGAADPCLNNQARARRARS